VLSLTLSERLTHIAISGATGSGKSTLLRHLAAQDIMRGDGLLLLDSHGDLAQDVLSDVPAWRHNHVCYLDCSDLEYPVGMNVLEDTAPDDRAAAVDGVVSAMRAIWADSWGPRLENVLRNAATALIETPNASLVLLPRLLTDDAFRASVVARISDPFARAFFDQRFNAWRDTYRDEVIDPVLNKVEQFMSYPSLRLILSQARSTLHLGYAMDHGRIVIVNLASGVIGQSAANLFGALLLGRLRAAAMARARQQREDRRPFHLLIDEAQAFGSQTVSSLLSETRKFALSCAMATQYWDALGEATRAALINNAGTLVAFRSSAASAAVVAPEFNRPHEEFNPYALQELDVGTAIVRTSAYEAARVTVPAPPLRAGSTDAVRRQSRQHYGRRRSVVEGNLARILAPTVGAGRPRRRSARRHNANHA
jgi:energy-coupling factor transporter ATP-binding protein EcfA2